MLAVRRLGETGPTAPGIEFAFGAKQFVTASGASVHAAILVVQERTGKWRFRCGFSQDGVALGGQGGTPFFIGFRHGLFCYITHDERRFN